MRILVTGGAGFVGSHIVEHLLADGDTVLVVDDLSTGREENVPPGAELSRLDILSREFAPLARSFQPDAITHCAAQPSVVVSMADPEADARINIVGGLNVARAAAESGARQLVYINTGGALYGHAAYTPSDEDHPVRPLSAYGLSKWTLECYLRLLLPTSLQLKTLRLANIYGPRQDPHGEAGVVAIFGSRMLRGEPVTIYGDGAQTRDFLYVGDAARAHALALRAAAPLTVNVSSATPVAVNDLFRLLARATGYSRPPIYEAERRGEIKHVVLANARARQLLAWEPEVSLEAGIAATLASLRDGNGHASG